MGLYDREVGHRASGVASYREEYAAVRQVLFVLAATSSGIGFIVLLSAGTGAGTPFGIGFAVLLVLATVIGGRWGRGPVARGVRGSTAGQRRSSGTCVALCGGSAVSVAA